MLSSKTTVPPSLDSPNFGLERDRIPPPKERHEYLPELMANTINDDVKGKKIREELKPLHIVQPEGVSFTMKGNKVEWQKWKMHVGQSLHNSTSELTARLVF